MIIKGIRGLFVGPKRRPRSYHAADAPYAVGGNMGFYIASRPGAYPMTAQQRRVRDVARQCNIHSGIAKRELMTAMKECVGPNMRRGG